MPESIELETLRSQLASAVETANTAIRERDEAVQSMLRDRIELLAQVSATLEAQQKAERCTRCAGDPPEFEDKDCECGGSKKITEQISGLRGCIQWWRDKHKIATGERDEARAEVAAMREAIKDAPHAQTCDERFEPCPEPCAGCTTSCLHHPRAVDKNCNCWKSKLKGETNA